MLNSFCFEVKSDVNVMVAQRTSPRKGGCGLRVRFGKTHSEQIASAIYSTADSHKEKERTYAAGGLQRSRVDALGLRRKLHPACALLVWGSPCQAQILPSAHLSICSVPSIGGAPPFHSWHGSALDVCWSTPSEAVRLLHIAIDCTHPDAGVTISQAEESPERTLGR
jgi:hypothetical protein